MKSSVYMNLLLQGLLEWNRNGQEPGQQMKYAQSGNHMPKLCNCEQTHGPYAILHIYMQKYAKRTCRNMYQICIYMQNKYAKYAEVHISHISHTQSQPQINLQMNRLAAPSLLMLPPACQCQCQVTAGVGSVRVNLNATVTSRHL